MKKISIIIPVYNTECFVERCILSCEKQDMEQEEFELIVVNDGSTDTSLNIIEKLALQYTNIELVNQENQGLSIARNNGLKIASGEYIWFVDSDDWIEKNCLNNLYNILKKDDLEALALSYVKAFPDRYVYCCTKDSRDGLVFTGREMLIEGIWSHCAPLTIYNNQFLKSFQLCFYKGIFHEDTEFTPRAYYYLLRVSSYSIAVYHYFYNDSSIMNRINPKKSFDNIIVAESLYKFSLQINDRKLRQVYNDIISLVINNALYNTYSMSIVDRKLLNDKLKNTSFLCKVLLGSKLIKYKLEGVLFYLFPKNIVWIYRLIKIDCN